jgi:mono/diheme cytochrome c family protein
MSGLYISLFIVLGLAVLFGWLASKAFKSPIGWVKWLGGILASLLALLFAAITVAGIYGTLQMTKKYTVTVPAISVAGTPEQVARGEHVVERLCVGCHSLNSELPVSGGTNMSEAAGMPMGDIYAPNLTPAGEIASWTDEDLFRVIRTGIHKQGRATAMATLPGVKALSDEDVLSVIAYLRQTAPVETDWPDYNPSLLVALLSAAGLFSAEVPGEITPILAPEKAANTEYGKYVFEYMECIGCHGEQLDGVVPPPFPAGPDIRPLIRSISLASFIHLIEANTAAATPEDIMVWKNVDRLDDVEKEALFLYLQEFVGE